MNSTAKRITGWSAAAAVVLGLGVLAAPAVASTVEGLSSFRSPVPTSDTAAEPADSAVAENTDMASAERGEYGSVDGFATPTDDPRWQATRSRDGTTVIIEGVPDGSHGDCALLSYPQKGADPLRDPVDTGPREFAMGEVGLVDGIPTTYTVAAGDAISAIGTRFCTFSTGLFYFNDVQLQGTIYPGDVLQLREH